MYVFSQALTPTGRIKIQGTLVIIITVLDLATVYYLVPIIGLYGWMLKFIISPTLFFIIYFAYFIKAIHFKFEKKNIFLMAYILLSFLTLMAVEKYVSSNYKIDFLIGLSLTGLSFLMLENSEKDFILKKIKIR